jgi:acyl-CoA dehydrogenase
MAYMNYLELTTEQKQIQDVATEFSRREVAPHAEEFDQSGRFPRTIFDKAREIGLANSLVPEEFGGAGMGRRELMLIVEQMGWACAGIAGALSLNNLLADVLIIAGTDAQKKKYFKRIREGMIGSYALTEPGAGSDAGAISTVAVKNGSTYILNGTKTWISNANEAEVFVVFAKTDQKAGHKGVSTFLVEKGTPGLTIGKKLSKMGQRAFPACEVILEGVEVSEEQLLGREGDGFLIAMKAFDYSRPMVAALAVGVSQRCLDESIKYGKSRVTMGKPIVMHQMIAAKIAEMGMRTHAARLLAWDASRRSDLGTPSSLHAAYAKAFASDTAVWCSSEAVQIHGGMGYSSEFPVEKLYRDAKVLQIYEGTNEIQRLIMARELCR